MNVLSLFDGMGGGYLALLDAGLPVTSYYASEINHVAQGVALYNQPNIVPIGNVRDVTYKDGTLTWLGGSADVNFDLILAGSPCTGFSRAGKHLAFDDPQSELYFQFERLLFSVNPKYWLLENVLMGAENEAIITERLGLAPHVINSSRVSAQKRNRLYWTNIKGVRPPTDQNIHVTSVLEKRLVRGFKHHTIPLTHFTRLNPKQLDNLPIVVSYSNHPERSGQVLKKAYTLLESNYRGLNRNNRQMAVIVAKTACHAVIRQTTPLEWERLQTVPDNYTRYWRDTRWGQNRVRRTSNTQRYRMLGNGWTIKVISGIMGYMENNNGNVA